MMVCAGGWRGGGLRNVGLEGDGGERWGDGGCK